MPTPVRCLHAKHGESPSSIGGPVRLALAAAVALLSAGPTIAQTPNETAAPESAADSPTAVTRDPRPAPRVVPKDEKEDSGPKNYWVAPRSSGTQRDTEPPRYVRNLDQTGWFRGQGLDGIDFGLDFRCRYERRDDDIRRNRPVLDEPLLTRWRGYLGVSKYLDPFRFYVEYEDAQRSNSQFPKDDRDVNQYEIIQAVAELHFADALGSDRPLRLQAGRLAFEYGDRRLIARNEWRNTTNNFQGFRAILGQQRNDWQLDLLAVKPITRDLDSLDDPEHPRWFYGALGEWRRWSSVVTFQPYWLLLQQNTSQGRTHLEKHTVGLRAYGQFGKSGFDWDLQGIHQFGDNGTRNVRTFATTSEAGYTFDHAWKPRPSLFFGYASGDRNPSDGVDQRFDRLYGFARPWSNDDYITFDNLLAPKVRIEFQPHERLRIDGGYSAYWVDSKSDRWGGANLNAGLSPAGQGSSFLGQELDIRARIKIGDRLDLTLGYAYFMPGDFPENLGRGEDSDFFYVEIAPRLLP